MEQAGVALIAQGASAYNADLKSATNATNSFVDAADNGSGKVSKAGEIMTGALRHIGTIAVDALAQAAKATAAFVGDSINLAGDFEAGMLNFQAVAGKDVDTKGLEQFRDLFLQIGKELPVSTADVQKAAIEMIKGGIDPAIVAAGGLRQNIQFAAAAMEGDLVAAAEISSKILGGWASSSATAQEKADFLTHSTDLLTKAANASAVDVKGLSLGIFNAQGIAKTAGVSFDDLTTTLAALAPRFASSSEAGNSLKNMIARLQPQTKTAAGYMLDLGLITEEGGNKFYDANGKFVGFEKTSQILRESLVGLTEQQKALYLQQIFGNDAMGSAAALADMGSEGYRNMAAAMGEANGVAENAALKQQGFNTALDNAKGSVEALQITIGSALLPVLTDLINNVVAPAVNTLTDMADAIFGNDEAFNRLSPTLQGIVSVIDLVIADTQNIIGAFDDAGAMSSEFGESIGLLASDLGLPGELIQDIVFAIQDLVGWFNSASNESSALDQVIVDLSDTWDNLLYTIEDAVAGYQAIAMAVLPVITTFIDAHGKEISAFFQETWDSIIQIVNLALEVYDSIVPPVLNAIAGFISDHGSEIQLILSGAWEMISSIIKGTLDTIKGVFKLALDVLHGDWEAAWTDIQAIGKAQWDAISGGVTGFLNMIAGIFGTTFDEIVQTWSDNWDMLLDIATSADWVQIGTDVMGGILQGLKDSADQVIDFLQGLIDDWISSVKKKLGIESPSTVFAEIGQFAVQGLMQGFSDTWPQLTDLVGSISKDLIDEMSDIGQQMNDAIADSFGATASIDRQIAKNLGSLAKIPEGFYRTATENALKNAQDIASTYADPATGAKFFALKSKQILEFQDLQQDINKETNAETKQRLIDQQRLILSAQEAEMAAFEQTTNRTDSPATAIADQINAIMKAISGIDLTDDQIKIVDMLASVWSSLQMPAMSQRSVAPPQTSYPSGGSSTNSTTTNVNMPIYTNNSPAALQQSWAVLQASMA